jgi:hypothetical protein
MSNGRIERLGTTNSHVSAQCNSARWTPEVADAVRKRLSESLARPAGKPEQSPE